MPVHLLAPQSRRPSVAVLALATADRGLSFGYQGDDRVTGQSGESDEPIRDRCV
jgi:hypothetical protein